MVVSNDTATRALQTIEDYIVPERVESFLNDLLEIPGNRSYRETIQLIRAKYYKGKPK